MTSRSDRDKYIDPLDARLHPSTALAWRQVKRLAEETKDSIADADCTFSVSKKLCLEVDREPLQQCVNTLSQTVTISSKLARKLLEDVEPNQCGDGKRPRLEYQGTNNGHGVSTLINMPSNAIAVLGVLPTSEKSQLMSWRSPPKLYGSSHPVGPVAIEERSGDSLISPRVNSCPQPNHMEDSPEIKHNESAHCDKEWQRLFKVLQIDAGTSHRSNPVWAAAATNRGGQHKSSLGHTSDASGISLRDSGLLQAASTEVEVLVPDQRTDSISPKSRVEEVESGSRGGPSRRGFLSTEFQRTVFALNPFIGRD